MIEHNYKIQKPQPFDISREPGMRIFFWFSWLAIFSSLFIYQFFLGKGIPRGEDAAEALNAAYYAICFGSILISIFIRWILIPKIKSISLIMILFFVGISFSESVVFYEIFLIGPKYPETQMIFFILSVMSTFQFIPTFLEKFITPVGQASESFISR